MQQLILATTFLTVVSSFAQAQQFSAITTTLPLEIEGTLDLHSDYYQGRPLDIFEITLTGHSDLRVKLSSEDLDPFLYVLDIQTGALYSNDDSNGLNSELELSLNAGKYWIGASTLKDASGKYSLTANILQPQIWFVASKDVATTLPQELATFMADVALDTGTTTRLLETPETAEALQRMLRTGWLEDNLQGAFLIGDIPLVYEHNLTVDLGYDSLSDHYYRALDCPYRESGKTGILNMTAGISVLGRCQSKIWVSRIRPPLIGSAGMEQLRRYLAKNHRLRRDFENYRDEMILEVATTREIKSDYREIVATNFTDHPWLSPAQVKVIQSTRATTLYNSFKTALAQKVAMLSLDVHGSPTAIQFQGEALSDAVDMFASELKSLPVRPKYIEFLSCSVGDYSVRDSFASTALFDTDVLLIEAASENIFVSDQKYANDFRGVYKTYGHGQSRAAVYSTAYTSDALHLFGDPTIRLNDHVVSATGPRMKIDGHIFDRPFDLAYDLGTTDNSRTIRKEIMIENTGSEPLEITTLREQGGYFINWLMYNGDSTPRQTNDFIFKLDIEDGNKGPAQYHLVIPPGDKKAMHVLFNPAADFMNTSSALYSTYMQFYTNDEHVSSFSIHLEGNATRASEPFPTSHGWNSRNAMTTAVFGGGATTDDWKSLNTLINPGQVADVGGVVLVDPVHLGRTGNFYVFVRIEGIGWYHQDSTGKFNFLGKNYIPAVDPAVATYTGHQLVSKHIIPVLNDFSFADAGLAGLTFELLFAYSVDNEDVLYFNKEKIIFSTAP